MWRLASTNLNPIYAHVSCLPRLARELYCKIFREDGSVVYVVHSYTIYYTCKASRVVSSLICHGDKA